MLRNPKDGFLSLFAAPARRVLQNKGITSVDQLSQFNEKQISELHGIGKHALRLMHQLLKQSGKDFRCGRMK